MGGALPVLLSHWSDSRPCVRSQGSFKQSVPGKSPRTPSTCQKTRAITSFHPPAAPVHLSKRPVSSIFPQRSVRGFVPVTVTQALLPTGRTFWATKSRVGVEAGPPPCSRHPARETQLQPGSRRIPEAPRASGPGHRPASRSPTLTSAATGPAARPEVRHEAPAEPF